jgi:hypothetical protein
LCGIIKNTFPKLDLFPSSGEEVRDIYSVGSVRNRKYIRNLDREIVENVNLIDETAGYRDVVGTVHNGGILCSI